MKITFKIVAALLLFTVTACHENPKNTFGGPSNNPQDTASSRRDTSNISLRTDGHEAN